VRSMTTMAVINVANTLTPLPLLGVFSAIWGSVARYTFALFLPYSILLWPVVAGRSAVVGNSAGPDAS
jgi:hypothetical protein